MYSPKELKKLLTKEEFAAVELQAEALAAQIVQSPRISKYSLHELLYAAFAMGVGWGFSIREMRNKQ
jgi:hypothetical protein